MLLMTPERARSQVTQEPDLLRIRIPPWRSLPDLLSSGLSLAFSLLIGSATVPSLWSDRGVPLFAIVWSGVMMCGVVIPAIKLIWTLAGVEIMTINAERLSLRREVLGVSLTRVYPVRHINGMRFSASLGYGTQRLLTPSWRCESIAFDFGIRTIHWATAISEAEARALVLRINENLDRLKASRSLQS